MTSITYAPHLSGDPPKSRSLPTSNRSIADAAKGTTAIVKPIALDKGDSLSIMNGRGTRIRAASGVLWVTEENCLEDYVLLPGDSMDFAQAGTAIVLAHRTSRIVIEVPAGVTPPRWVELALHSGEPAMRIALGASATLSPSTLGESIGRTMKFLFAEIRSIVATLPPSQDVLRPSAGDHARYGRGQVEEEIERAFTSKWMMWRM